MTSSERPVTRKELEEILRRTIVSCFRNPAPRRLIQKAVSEFLLKELMTMICFIAAGIFLFVTLLPKASNWLGWGWVGEVLFGLALVPVALYFQFRHSARTVKEDEEWDKRIEMWMIHGHHMKCQNCGFKGDHEQDFMSTGMPDKECCPQCGSGKYYAFRGGEDE